MPLEETDADGNITRYYIWAPSTGSGQAGFRLLAHIETDGTVHYYHSDELGSTLAITDESGAVTDEFAYSPYGKCTARTGTTQTPFCWIGGYGVYYDAPANLHLTLYRAYSADMRRWLSADPLGIDGGPNVYAMANLNPLAFVDPYGLCAASAGRGAVWENYTPGLSSPRTMNAAQYEANATLTLGAGFRPDSPIASTMAQDNAFNYITAGSSAVVADDIARGVGKAVQLIRGTPTPTTTALSPYRVTTQGETFQHYSSVQHADSLAGGLRSGGYATTTRGLTGSQAQSGLALPHPTPPNAVYTISPPAGTPIRVNPIAEPLFGQPGGLPEVQFTLGTPPGSVSGPTLIP
jgi:RHS repeat-associated protein